MSAAGPAPFLERLLRVLPASLYLTFTWFASSQGAQELPSAMPDKLLHFGEYALLTLLLVFAMTGFDAARISWRVLVSAAAMSVAWGVLDEVHQSFVPTRESSGLDLVADAVGAAAGASVVGFLARRERRSA